jgi:RNA-directed DNA polymerase
MGTQSQRRRAQQREAATHRLIRYADDFVVMVNGSRAHTQDLYSDIETILAPFGLRLAPDKTQIGIDEGLDFLGSTCSGTSREEAPDS